MLECEYEGKKYRRNNAKWVDRDNLVVPLYLQNILNRISFEQSDLKNMSYEDAKLEGDKFKKSESYVLAVKYYEQALDKADTLRKTAVVLPRITSCLRKIKQPRRVVDLLSEAKEKYGEEIIDQVLLTSVAAAYCDLGEPENALRCCRWGYKILRIGNGEQSPELSNVFLRANRMIDPHYSPKEFFEDK